MVGCGALWLKECFKTGGGEVAVVGERLADAEVVA